MPCPTDQDQLLLLAADALDPADRDALRAHLATGCPACAGQLAQAQSLLAQLPLTLPLITPPPEARQKLLARIATEASTDTAPAPLKLPIPTTRPRLTGWPTALAASVAVIIGLAAWSSLRHLQDKNNALRADLAAAQSHSTDLTQQLASAQDELSRQNDLVSHLQHQVREAADTQNFLRSPNLLLVDIKPTPDAPPTAKMTILRDQANTHWLVVADNLSPLPPNRAYELWFITPDQKKLPAGTFTVGPNGNASLLVTLPKNLHVALTAVTDEPAGGSQSPTGKIRLLGSPDHPAT